MSWRAALLTLLLCTGCQSAAESATAAVLVEPSAVMIQELEATISAALAGVPVKLTPDAFSSSSLLTLEPANQRTPAGSLASGRISQHPEQFQLLLTAHGCLLERVATGQRFPLADTHCSAEHEPAPQQ